MVAWGDMTLGGDINAVNHRLQSSAVQDIQVADGSCAALLADGSVVTWGFPGGGGCSKDVQDQLVNVQQIQANWGAFAAIKADETVITWGSGLHGGFCPVQSRLVGVQRIQSAHGAFTAIMSNGTAVSWGYRIMGGDSSEVQEQLPGL